MLRKNMMLLKSEKEKILGNKIHNNKGQKLQRDKIHKQMVKIRVKKRNQRTV